MTDFPPPPRTPATPPCPDCGTPLDAQPAARCPECRLPLRGATAGRLWQVDLALKAVEEHRLSLLQVRGGLLGELRARRDEPDDEPRPAMVWPDRTGAEVSGRSAQAVLLVLGGVLVSIAALVFTVVSWGELGIGGRAAVLLAVTGCALAVPAPLRRRGLGATAETSAAIGLALVLLDCFAMRAAGVAGLDSANPFGYWAAATGLVGAGALVYGLAMRMRVPLLGGFLLGLLPGLLAVRAAGPGDLTATSSAAAMVATAAVDYGLLRAAAGRENWRRFLPGPVVPAAAAIAAVWALMGGIIASGASLRATLDPAAHDRLATTAWAWPPLGGLALLALAVALPYPKLGYPGAGPYERRMAAGTAGAAVLLAAGGTLGVALPAGWAAVGYVAPAALVTAATGAVLRRGRAGRVIPVGVFAVSAATLMLGAVVPLGSLLPVLLEPLRHLRSAWTDGLAPGWAWGVPAVGLTVLWLLVGTAVAVRASGGAVGSTGPLGAALAALAVPALALLPVASGLPYGVAVGTVTVLVVVAAGWSAFRTPGPWTAAVLITATPLALLWALADRPATIAVLAVGAVLAITLTVRGPQPAFTAALAVVLVGAEATAVGATAGLALPDVMLTVLAVGVGTVPVAGRVSARPVSLSVESAGYGLAALALILTAGHPARLSFDLAVAGIAGLGVALRPERRRAAAGVAAALLIAASWLRLALWGVHAPEPYSLTVATGALVLGHVRRRRFPDTGSWTAYGPGLAVGLLPSLLAVWTDGQWLRPLLLGSAALAVTVLGVRFRLQSPLVLAGSTLLLVGGHELAPTVVQVLGLLPRWAPLAAAGLLLLALGATYEQRLRDARRLREALRSLD